MKRPMNGRQSAANDKQRPRRKRHQVANKRGRPSTNWTEIARAVQCADGVSSFCGPGRWWQQRRWPVGGRVLSNQQRRRARLDRLVFRLPFVTDIGEQITNRSLLRATGTTCFSRPQPPGPTSSAPARRELFSFIATTGPAFSRSYHRRTLPDICIFYNFFSTKKRKRQIIKLRRNSNDSARIQAQPCQLFVLLQWPNGQLNRRGLRRR